MRIPNADKAVISVEKLRDHLLNPPRRRGGAKARLLLSLGHSRERPEQLELDLRQQHLSLDAATESADDYRRRFEIVAPIVGPGGRSVIFLSVWQIDRSTEAPRLITLYPR